MSSFLKCPFLFKLIIFSFLFIEIKSHRNLFSRKLSDDQKLCTLTGQPSRDPFPSLSKCYKYNNEACCLSVHDEIINDHINNLLSTSCIRKYSQFENLMCLGCHPLERNYIDTDRQVIRICRSFAESMWNNTENDDGLNYPTKIFDNCGFKATDDIIDKLDNLSRPYRNQKYIIPSETFMNFSDFFNFIQIPFYENYTIELNDTDCYNNNYYLGQNYFLFIILIAIILSIDKFKN